MCVTWLIHMCDMTHSYVWHDSFICVTWLIHMCDMTHPYVWHDSFICVTYLIHMCATTRSQISYLWTSHGTHEWVMWHMCTSHSHIWISEVAHMNESWHTYEWVMARIWMRHVTHMNEAWHRYEWDMPHISMCHAAHIWWVVSHIHRWFWNDHRAAWTSLPRKNGLCHTHDWVTNHVTHTVVSSCHTYECVTPHIWTSHVTHMTESRVMWQTQ